MFKAFICSFVMCVFTIVALEVVSMKGVQVGLLCYGTLVVMGLTLGFSLGRYISWGWLLGGGAGIFVGFYGLLLLLAGLWPNRSYEDGLIWLFIGAGIGMLIGGFTLSKSFKKRAIKEFHQI